MNWVSLIVSLISGIIGGNVAGAALPDDKKMSALGNTLSGLFGGVAGNYILQALGILTQAGIFGPEGAAAAPQFDLSTFLANVGTSGVSGAVLMAIVSWIKSNMQKTS